MKTTLTPQQAITLYQTLEALLNQFDRDNAVGPAPKVQMIDGFPRRHRVDLMSPAETAIRDAVGVVESSGAHPLLTEAVVLLNQARDKVADYVELGVEAK